MGDIESRTGGDFRIFNSPWIQLFLERGPEGYMLTAGTESDWSFDWLRFGEESGGIGYQSTLDALHEPSDAGLLGCLQDWPDKTRSAVM